MTCRMHFGPSFAAVPTFHGWRRDPVARPCAERRRPSEVRENVDV